MEKHFLTVLHEGEVMDEMSLDMLKGGSYRSDACPSLQNCGCFKAVNGSPCGNRNQATPDTIVVSRPTN